MAKQKRLEREAIQYREEALLKNAYDSSENGMYSENHEDARTHDDKDHPWGKGDPNFVGVPYVIPNELGSKTAFIPQIGTADGGGSYDKFGRNGLGGREYLSRINIYSPLNAYGPDSVDTSINVDSYGQYKFNTRSLKTNSAGRK